MRVNIFSKEQIKDLQFKINKYYEKYDEVHKWNKDEDLRDIDAMTVDSMLLSLDNALRMMPCEVFEEVKGEIEASPEEIKDVLDNID